MLSDLITELQAEYARHAEAGLVLDPPAVRSQMAFLRIVEIEAREMENRLESLTGRPHAPLAPSLSIPTLAPAELPARTPPTIEEIAAAVCGRFGISFADLMGPTRPHDVALARQATMWLAVKLTRLDYGTIGAGLGGRDRATIRYGYFAIERMRTHDRALALKLDTIRATFDPESALETEDGS
jgi:hypothetical protein